MSSDLYYSCLNYLETENNNNQDVIDFVEKLPISIRHKVNMVLHKKTYSKIEFLRLRSSNFITWICPLLKQMMFQQGSYIYYENDPIEEIYFLSEGAAGFVLPFRRNIVYVEIEEGDEFGHSDIFEAAHDIEGNMDELDAVIQTMNGKQQMKRAFTV